MVTTLTGNNALGWQTRITGLVNQFVSQNGDLALERLDGDNASLDQVGQALNSSPLLTPQKLVILREPSQIKDFTDQVEQIISQMTDATELVIVEPKLDKRQSYYKYLKAKTKFEDYQELEPTSLAKWLSEYAKDHGGELSLSEANYLIERVGPKQQLLKNELDKLVLYEPKISKETIDRLTDATPQSTIFELLTAAFNGQLKKALNIYKEQRRMGVMPPQIIAMLVWQLHLLALVKAAKDKSVSQIASDTGISPYSLNKSQSIAARLTLSQIKQLVDKLLQIDMAVKSQSLDIDEALENYLLQTSALV